MVAGPRDGTIDAYKNSRVIDLGYRSPTDFLVVLGALDLAIICSHDTDFGRFCFPQKLEEMLACEISFFCSKCRRASQGSPFVASVSDSIKHRSGQENFVKLFGSKYADAYQTK